MKGRRPVSAVAKLASPKSHRSAAAFKQSENGDENSKAPLVNDFNKVLNRYRCNQLLTFKL